RLGRPGPDGAPLPDWPTLFDGIADEADRTRRTTVILVDDAHLPLGTRGAFGGFLEALWARLRARALPVHLVLAGRGPHFERELERSAPELRPAAGLELTLGGLSLREVTARVPGYSPRDRLRTWAIFGGLPERVRHLDPGVGLATNVERLLFAPGAPLLEAGLRALEGDVQSLPRYASLLGALAAGRTDWGGLRAACPDFETGSQMAPYVGRLESLGLVDVRRSLDAGERSRNRRYEPADPFLAFWYRFVLPVLGQVTLLAPPDPWERWISPGLDGHVARVFPRACREWLVRHGDEALPERARLAGGLWGPGYDLPVAGTLRNGAIVYGACRWRGDPVDADAFSDVGRQLRETRYGFGREGRLRVVFSATGFTTGARRAVGRDPLAYGVGIETIVGP
ncbi:MAG: hypothetical protein PVI57_20460, partial [Gemmatimonadota bacterium]